MQYDEEVHLTVMAVVMAAAVAITPFGALVSPLIVGAFVRRYVVMLLAIGVIVAWMTVRGTYEGPTYGDSFTPIDFFVDRALYIVPWFLGLAHLAYLTQCLVRRPDTGGEPDEDGPGDLGVRTGPPRGVERAGASSPQAAQPVHPPTWKRGDASPVLERRPAPQVETRPVWAAPPDDAGPPKTPARATPLQANRGRRHHSPVLTLAGFVLVFGLSSTAMFAALGALGVLPPLGSLWPSVDRPGPVRATPPRVVGIGSETTPTGLCESPDDRPFLVPEQSPYRLARSTIDGVPFVWMTDRQGDVWWMEDVLAGGQTAARVSGPGGHDCGVFTNGYLSYGSSVYWFDGTRLVNRRVTCVVETDSIVCAPNPAW